MKHYQNKTDKNSFYSSENELYLSVHNIKANVPTYLNNWNLCMCLIRIFHFIIFFFSITLSAYLFTKREYDLNITINRIYLFSNLMGSSI